MGSNSVKLRHYSFRGIVNFTCPLDIYKCPFVHWTNRNVHWTYINVHLSIGRTEMSIGHSNVHSSIGRTEMSIGHPNVHSSIGRMDEWTLSNGKHSSLLSTWGQTQLNKTPAQAFTPPADEKKMGTIWIFVYYAVYGSGRGRCRDFLVILSCYGHEIKQPIKFLVLKRTTNLIGPLIW